MVFRKIIVAALASLTTSFSHIALAADDFPTKPIRIIAPSSPGGILDQISRLIGDKLSQQMGGHPVVVENMPGGGGIIGIQGMLRAQPDGHTLVMGSIGPNAANYSLYSKLPYKASDFAPVISVLSMANVLVVNPSVPVKTLDEFKAYGIERDGDFSMAISTIGASGHLMGELLKSDMGFSTINVAYKGAAPAMTDLIGGQVNFMVDNIITAKPMIEAGRVRAVAITSEERNPFLPDVPTVVEQGYPQLAGGTWLGLLVSSRTPPERVRKLNAVLDKVLQMPETREAIVRSGGVPAGGTPEQFEQFILKEKDRWEKVITDVGMTIN